MADEKGTPTVDMSFTENTGGVDPRDTGSEDASSAPQETPITDEGGDLTSTVEFAAATKEDDSSGADENAQDPGKKDGEEGKKGAGEDKDKGKGAGADDETSKLDATFQQSPRFQELIRDKQNLTTEVATLKGQITTLTDQMTQFAANQGKKTGESTDYENILAMPDEVLVENFEKDPKGFLANFGRQIYAEVMSEIDERDSARDNKQAAQSREQGIRNMYAQYEKDNPEFTTMWGTGEIQAYQKSHPGHTPISAYEAIQKDKKIAEAEAAKTSAVEAAVKQAKEDAEKAAKVKTHAQTLPGGPQNGSAASQKGTPAELQDTKKHGGLIRTLTDRSLRRTAR